jgi:predicted ester cyclase
MSLESNKEISRRVLGLWAAGCPDQAEDLVTADYVNHQMPDVEGGTSSKSLAEWKSLFTDFVATFSEASVEILLQVAEGDLVATRWRLSGKHTGEFRGLAPSGKEVSWTGVHTDRFADGRVSESWVDWDKYSMLEGIGAVGSADV